MFTPPNVDPCKSTVNNNLREIPVNIVHTDINEDSQSSELVNKQVFMEFEIRSRSDLRGVSNVAASPRHGLYIVSPLDWGTGGFDVPILIDCGATVSLLDEQIYNAIPDNVRPPLANTKAKVTFADGSIQSCAGQVTLPLKIGGTWHEIAFLVGNYTDSAILGMQDLQALGLTIDFEGMVVEKEGKWKNQNERATLAEAGARHHQVVGILPVDGTNAGVFLVEY